MKKERKKGRGGGHGRENDDSRHLFVCLCVRHRNLQITARAAAAGGRARWPGQFGPPIVPCAPPCVSLGLKKPGDFTVSEGHGYPLVSIMPNICLEQNIPLFLSYYLGDPK